MEIYASSVRRYIREAYAQRAQSCFERETRNRSNVRGTVVIGLEVRSDGRVGNVRPVQDGVGIPSLTSCLVRQVAGWRLPDPPQAPLPLEIPFSR